MNAPLPTLVTRGTATRAAETIARRRRTRGGSRSPSAWPPRPQGEVLFDAASRGRYATDASIYQIMPVGVFVPTHAPTTSRSPSTSPATSACRCCRAAPAPSQCGQTTGAALVIDASKHLRNVRRGRRRAAMTADGRARHRARRTSTRS